MKPEKTQLKRHLENKGNALDADERYRIKEKKKNGVGRRIWLYDLKLDLFRVHHVDFLFRQ